MSKYFGKCELLKSHDKEENFCEIDYCPRVLSGDEMRLILGAFSGKIKSFASDLDGFLNNPDFKDVDITEYFYCYYRKMDTYLYWANLHLMQMEDDA